MDNARSGDIGDLRDHLWIQNLGVQLRCVKTAAKQFAGTMTVPPDGSAFAKWVDLEDAPTLLRSDLDLEDLVLYASAGDLFLHTVLVPTERLTPLNVDDLLSWNHGSSSSWGLCYSFSPPNVWLEPPMKNAGSQTLDDAEQLVFLRGFEGRSDQNHYVEILQKLTHAFGLHFVDERNAYCRIDKHGDIEDVIGIYEVDDVERPHRGGTIVTINRALLDEYMAITGSTAVRMFDITRWKPGSMTNWPDRGPNTRSDGDLHYRFQVNPAVSGYMRGVQVVGSRMTKEEAASKSKFGAREEREYATFVAQDWKNGKVGEISCGPGHTANYFTTSDLPFELSLAFFRPDVLLRYKSDTDKYRLQDRSITCRGAWHLQTFDINEAGQVHTYLCYLRDLPYQEQLHWKAYNEPPKGPISRRAFRTDFEGSWETEYDAISSLREIIGQINNARPSWWSVRSEKLLYQVHYPVSESADEWANELLNLDQWVVEGLRGKPLRKLAEGLGRAPDLRLGSLKLVEECLMGLGYEKERALEVTAPLHTVHYLRSVVKAHENDAKGREVRRAILKEHGTYRKHFQALCAECDDAMRSIAEALDEG